MISTDTSRRSSNIARVDYDPASLSLIIRFKTGGAYRYSNVSPLDHLKFMDAPSLGHAYNTMFWGQPKLHPSQKLSPTSGH